MGFEKSGQVKQNSSFDPIWLLPLGKKRSLGPGSPIEGEKYY